MFVPVPNQSMVVHLKGRI